VKRFLIVALFVSASFVQCGYTSLTKVEAIAPPPQIIQTTNEQETQNKEGVKTKGGFGFIYSFPSAPDEFGDCWNNGFGFLGSTNIPLTKTLYLNINSHYIMFGFDEDGFLDWVSDESGVNIRNVSGLTISGANASALSATLSLKTILSPKESSTKFYLLGGMGINYFSIDDISFYYRGDSFSLDGDSETKPILNIGAGLFFPISPDVDLFLEARYCIIFTDDDNTQYIPLSLGISF